MFLGAGSVMHGMDDDVNMRHYGALQQGDAGHVPDLRDGLPRDHRRSPASPASGPRTRSSRPRSPHNLAGRPVRPARRRRHRLLHDPADADDLLRQASAGRTDVHPHESPKVMTVPADRARRAVRRSAACCCSTTGSSTGSRRSSAQPPHEDLADPGARDQPARRGRRGRDRRRRRLVPASASATCRARRPTKVSVFTTRRPRRPLRRRVQRGGHRCGPGQRFTGGLVAFDGGVVDGAVEGTAPCFGGLVRPAPARPERLRPLLRPVPARRRRPGPARPRWW